jgi:hypothetical protein
MQWLVSDLTAEEHIHYSQTIQAYSKSLLGLFMSPCSGVGESEIHVSVFDINCPVSNRLNDTVNTTTHAVENLSNQGNCI